MTAARPRGTRRRALAAVGLVIVIACGLLVHGGLPDTSATDIAGDALYAAAAYLGVVLLAPRLAAPAVGAFAAGWCVAVELLQLTALPAAAASAFRPAVLLLGTAFDPRDLAVYLAAVALLVVADIGAALRSGRFAGHPQGDASEPRRAGRSSGGGGHGSSWSV
ncbi:DUF2809 domain-containing protein [Microbacterium sp. Marseille-Q6965]|uniref:DUF2809 domain-containing protein n=1 Tax=Microbacterium sp. Marseille-Q6965 TaxID=2965072 RepID=UPI0021B79112|nr:DUF2809 domain-containing protein [Microbacterium sp. Marseille-Q6965]